jgi:serine phosphatase RsbU (regulator of sigma subunit)
LAATFHATSRKGVSLSETLVTLNDSLRSILPPWLFCAAAFLELDPTGTRLAVWNAGLPAVIVRHVDGSLLRLGSRHAPLGILEPQEFATTFEQVAVAEGDRIVVFSDGLVEAKRSDGKEWGLPAIEGLMADSPPDVRLMEVLLSGVETFRDGAPRSDDTSLVEVVAGPGPRFRGPSQS